MSELEASPPEELGDISIAEFVSYSAKQNLKNDIGGDFNKIEGRASTLIESATTTFAAKPVAAQVGFPLEW